jgi:hypothetical protein
MRERGVVLRSWRVGADLMDESNKILRDAVKRGKDKGVDKGSVKEKGNGPRGSDGRRR